MPLDFTPPKNSYPNCLTLIADTKEGNDLWLTVKFGYETLRLEPPNSKYRLVARVGLQSGTINIKIDGDNFIPGNKRNLQGRFDLSSDRNENLGFCEIEVDGHNANLIWRLKNGDSRLPYMHGTLTKNRIPE